MSSDLDVEAYFSGEYDNDGARLASLDVDYPVFEGGLGSGGNFILGVEKFN